MRAAFFTALGGAVASFWLALGLVLTAAAKDDERYATASLIVAFAMLAFIVLATLAALKDGDDDGPAIA